MILANVNIGTGPSAGDGDPLRTAFTVINQNFTQIQSNVNALTNSVTTVAGRTGNITLTTQDIIGINNYITNANLNSTINNVVSNTYATTSYVDSKIVANITAIISGAPGALDTLNELANALGNNASFSTYITNSLTSLTSNDAVQSGQIASVQGNLASVTTTVGTHTTNIATLQSDVSTLTANAAVQAGLLANVVAATNYSDSNVASYLTTYSGNIKVDNIIFDDLSEQHTAYTGVQWRSNLTSNVTVKPSWLSLYPDGQKTILNTNYGFDAGGMWFYGTSDNEHAYPVRTNLHLHETDVLEVIATVNFAHTGDDHGIAIFSSGATPIWKTATDATRIAFQFNSGIPLLYGQTTANTAPGSPVLVAGNYYTVKFTYDPTNTVTVETYSGNTATGSAIDTRTISEVLPAGDYVVGFDADQDVVGNRSYFTNLTVRTLTNTVVNDLEVIGEISGNIVLVNGTITLPQTDMNASPQPTSYPGITFTDGSNQITAYTASYANASPTPTSLGIKGNIVQDGTYMYHCIAANTWVRTSITTSW